MSPAQLATVAPEKSTLVRARESSRRLAELLGREHVRLGEFLVELAEFDDAELWKSLGHASLFMYLHRDLHLSLGAAHVRMVAARLVRRFPEMVEPLRDGRLCLSVVTEVARVLTRGNRAEVLPQFFGLSKREAKALAARIDPVEVVPQQERVTVPGGSELTGSLPFRPDEVRARSAEDPVPETVLAAAAAVVNATPPTVDYLNATHCRLHLTVTSQFLDKVERARAGQSHARPGASRAEILEIAIDLLLEAQARRRGLVGRPQQNPRASSPGHVPIAVRRAVWERDRGVCQWPLDSGGTCGSMQRVELDHVVPRGLGGASTIDNCRLLCKVHNDLAARLIYGNDWMDRFTRTS